jgi:hypothetical protein
VARGKRRPSVFCILSSRSDIFSLSLFSNQNKLKTQKRKINVREETRVRNYDTQKFIVQIFYSKTLFCLYVIYLRLLLTFNPKELAQGSNICARKRLTHENCTSKKCEVSQSRCANPSETPLSSLLLVFFFALHHGVDMQEVRVVIAARFWNWEK